MTAYPAISGTQAIADPNNPQFNTLKPNLDSGVSVTKSDSTTYSPPLLALYIGSGGALAVRMATSQTVVTLSGVATGSLLPLMVDRVMSTNTTASSIIGFY